MISEEKDYYEILGVSRDATTDEIKKAYRQLARTYHPDLNMGNRESEEKFKEISEAYAVLSNEEKRRQYDSFILSGDKSKDFNSEREFYNSWYINALLLEGLNQLLGIKIFIWFIIVCGGIYFCILLFEEPLMALLLLVILILPSIFSLIGIKNRRPYTVILVRFLLVLIFPYFPIGTFIGSILWNKINHPATKIYLNYYKDLF